MRVAQPGQHPILHGLHRYCTDREPNRRPDLNSLPWNRIVRTVFSRAAATAGITVGHQQVVDLTLNQAINQANGLHDIKNLGSAIRQFARTGQARRTLDFDIEASVLKLINTPGAWLLDTLFTMQLILFGDTRSTHKLVYRAVGNYTHKEMLARCGLTPDGTAAHGYQSHYGSSFNNRGNQSEYLAWLALEADRCDIVLAMALHARNIQHELDSHSSHDGDTPGDRHTPADVAPGHHRRQSTGDTPGNYAYEGSSNAYRSQPADTAADHHDDSWGHPNTEHYNDAQNSSESWAQCTPDDY